MNKASGSDGIPASNASITIQNQRNLALSRAVVVVSLLLKSCRKMRDGLVLTTFQILAIC